MNKQEFLQEMQDVLQRDAEITLEMPLADIEEWDSLAIMATNAFLQHNFSVRLSLDEFKKFETINDIAKAAGLSL